MKLDESIDGQVARGLQTLVINDTNHLPPGVGTTKPSDPEIHTLVVTPIMFKDRYYGNLMLSHEDVGYFRDTDVRFFEGLAQQLASTIYRLEIAEGISPLDQSALELTHRLTNRLQLVDSFADDIQSELEKKGVTSPIVSKKLNRIVEAVRGVLALSRKLKEASTKSRDAMAGEPVIISPEVLLKKACNQAAPLLPSNIQIRLEVDNDVANIFVIPDLVLNILENLVTNANQAMSEGGTITLKALNADRLVALEVVDTGKGIPLEYQTKIFDLFFSTKRGIGFGLWNARRNAIKCGGDLKVESQPGQGATFRLLLPRINGEDTISL
ncbi:MAG: hypothetical protein NVSMB33_16150 [Ktedonobacteraceae bacterium]